MNRYTALGRRVFLALVLSLAPLSTAAAQDTPTRVIVFLVDGAGVGHWSLANLKMNDLAVRQFPVVGLVDTRPVAGIYTESASTNTSYAIGVRTYVGAVGVGPDSLPRQNVLEAAQERGLATGMVTTGRITDATPAAFSVHLTDRHYEWEIARLLTLKNITVLLGGGRASFESWDRPDSTDLLTPLRKHYTYVETTDRLRALDIDTVNTLFGLFTPSDMPVYPERSPSLAEMASAALAVVDKNPNGFFLLLETESTDTEAHANVPLEVLAGEMLDVDATIRLGLEYQSRHPETLFLVLGDHETGGLAVQAAGAANLVSEAASRLDASENRLNDIAGLLTGVDSALADSARVMMARLSNQLRAGTVESGDADVLVARYTTGSHSVLLVPLFARGPGAERFSGLIDNYRVGQMLLEFVRR